MTRPFVLIVSCHPAPSSRCAKIAAFISELLAQRAVPFAVDDLYLADFDPVLSQTEMRNYYDGVVARDISELVAHVREATELVFIFPLWMFDMPAMLKGYFEKVFRPQAAFRFNGKEIVPLLSQIKRMTVVVTHGRSETETASSGDASRVFFETSLPSLLPGLVSNKRFDLYDLDSPNRVAIEDELAAVRELFDE